MQHCAEMDKDVKQCEKSIQSSSNCDTKNDVNNALEPLLRPLEKPHTSCQKPNTYVSTCYHFSS